MTLHSLRPDRKIAIVTCSVEGLNAGTTLALAKAGASVAYHSPEDRHKRMMHQSGAVGRKAAFRATDLADPDACARMINATLKSSSSIAIPGNNAELFAVPQRPITRRPAAIMRSQFISGPCFGWLTR